MKKAIFVIIVSVIILITIISIPVEALTTIVSTDAEEDVLVDIDTSDENINMDTSEEAKQKKETINQYIDTYVREWYKQFENEIYSQVEAQRENILKTINEYFPNNVDSQSIRNNNESIVANETSNASQVLGGEFDFKLDGTTPYYTDSEGNLFYGDKIFHKYTAQTFEQVGGITKDYFVEDTEASVYVRDNSTNTVKKITKQEYLADAIINDEFKKAKEKNNSYIEKTTEEIKKEAQKKIDEFIMGKELDKQCKRIVDTTLSPVYKELEEYVNEIVPGLGKVCAAVTKGYVNTLKLDKQLANRIRKEKGIETEKITRDKFNFKKEFVNGVFDFLDEELNEYYNYFEKIAGEKILKLAGLDGSTSGTTVIKALLNIGMVQVKYESSQFITTLKEKILKDYTGEERRQMEEVIDKFKDDLDKEYEKDLEKELEGMTKEQKEKVREVLKEKKKRNDDSEQAKKELFDAIGSIASNYGMKLYDKFDSKIKEWSKQFGKFGASVISGLSNQVKGWIGRNLAQCVSQYLQNTFMGKNGEIKWDGLKIDLTQLGISVLTSLIADEKTQEWVDIGTSLAKGTGGFISGPVLFDVYSELPYVFRIAREKDPAPLNAAKLAATESAKSISISSAVGDDNVWSTADYGFTTFIPLLDTTIFNTATGAAVNSVVPFVFPHTITVGVPVPIALEPSSETIATLIPSGVAPIIGGVPLFADSGYIFCEMAMNKSKTSYVQRAFTASTMCLTAGGIPMKPSLVSGLLNVEAAEFLSFTTKSAAAGGYRNCIKDLTTNAKSKYSSDEGVFVVGPFKVDYIRSYSHAVLRGKVEFGLMTKMTIYDQDGNEIPEGTWAIAYSEDGQFNHDTKSLDKGYNFPYPNEEFYIVISQSSNENVTSLGRIELKYKEMQVMSYATYLSMMYNYVININGAIGPITTGPHDPPKWENFVVTAPIPQTRAFWGVSVLFATKYYVNHTQNIYLHKKDATTPAWESQEYYTSSYVKSDGSDVISISSGAEKNSSLAQAITNLQNKYGTASPYSSTGSKFFDSMQTVYNTLMQLDHNPTYLEAVGVGLKALGYKDYANIALALDALEQKHGQSTTVKILAISAVFAENEQLKKALNSLASTVEMYEQRDKTNIARTTINMLKNEAKNSNDEEYKQMVESVIKLIEDGKNKNIIADLASLTGVSDEELNEYIKKTYPKLSAEDIADAKARAKQIKDLTSSTDQGKGVMNSMQQINMIASSDFTILEAMAVTAEKNGNTAEAKSLRAMARAIAAEEALSAKIEAINKRTDITDEEKKKLITQAKNEYEKTIIKAGAEIVDNQTGKEYATTIVNKQEEYKKIEDQIKLIEADKTLTDEQKQKKISELRKQELNWGFDTGLATGTITKEQYTMGKKLITVEETRKSLQEEKEKIMNDNSLTEEERSEQLAKIDEKTKKNWTELAKATGTITDKEQDQLLSIDSYVKTTEEINKERKKIKNSNMTAKEKEEAYKKLNQKQYDSTSQLLVKTETVSKDTADKSNKLVQNYIKNNELNQKEKDIKNSNKSKEEQTKELANVNKERGDLAKNTFDIAVSDKKVKDTVNKVDKANTTINDSLNKIDEISKSDKTEEEKSKEIRKETNKMVDYVANNVGDLSNDQKESVKNSANLILASGEITNQKTVAEYYKNVSKMKPKEAKEEIKKLSKVENDPDKALQIMTTTNETCEKKLGTSEESTITLDSLEVDQGAQLYDNTRYTEYDTNFNVTKVERPTEVYYMNDEEQGFTISIGGVVWKDGHTGMENDYDGQRTANANGDIEKGVEGVKVVLISEKTGKIGRMRENNKWVNAITYTDEGGFYHFTEVEAGKYYVEFEYDGEKYMATTYLSDGEKQGNTIKYRVYPDLEEFDNNSKAAENADERQAFNDTFYTIQNGIAVDKSGTKRTNLDYETKDGVSSLITLDEQGHVLPKFAMHASSKEFGISYPIDENYTLDDENSQLLVSQGSQSVPVTYEYKRTNEYMFHVNLGLVERAKMDLAVTQDVYNITTTVNEKREDYIYNKRGILALFDANLKHTDTYKDISYSRDLYKADFEFRSKDYTHSESLDSLNNKNKYNENNQEQIANIQRVKTEELEERVFVTYKITLKNQALLHSAIINELTYYYDETYKLVKENVVQNIQDDYGDVQETIVAKRPFFILSDDENTTEYPLDWEELGMVNGYKCMKTLNGNPGLEDIIMSAGEMYDVFVTFEVDKDNDGTLKIGENKKKNTIVEISSYTSLEVGETTRNHSNGLIDRDSQPDNISIGSYNDYEDDTDQSPTLTITANNSRKITGYVWNDERMTTLSTGQVIGNGRRDSQEELINGVRVQLVEIIKGADETEYEYVWKEMRTGLDTLKYINQTINYNEQVQKGRTSQKSITTDTDLGAVEKGQYKFNDYVAGNYIVRFIYGDDKKTVLSAVSDGGLNQTSYNGTDYKSTKYQNGENTTSQWINLSDVSMKNEFFSDAKDDTRRRKEVINYSSTIKNRNAEILASFDARSDKNYYNTEKQEDLINNTWMFADTAKMNVKIEYDTDKSNGLEEQEYKIENIDFGLEERPETKLEINKEITDITISYASGEKIVNTAAGMTQNVNWLRKAKEEETGYSYKRENYKNYYRETGKVHIYMDEEIMQGANITITYKITVKNNSEVDYTGFTATLEGELGSSYVKGKVSDKDNIVTTSADLVIDYVDNSLTFRKNDNPDWSLIETMSDFIQTEDGTVLKPTRMDYEAFQNYIEGIKGEKYVDEHQREIMISFKAYEQTGQITGIDGIGNSTTSESNKQNTQYDVQAKLLSNSEVLANMKQRGYLSTSIEQFGQTKPAKVEKSPLTQIIVTKALSKPLKPGESTSVNLVLSKTLSPNDDDDTLNYGNITEILQYSNTVGRRDMDAIPGNQDPDEEPQEYDSDFVERVLITPPTGANRAYYFVLGTVVLVILAGGIIIIKKKVIDKK